MGRPNMILLKNSLLFDAFANLTYIWPDLMYFWTKKSNSIFIVIFSLYMQKASPLNLKPKALLIHKGLMVLYLGILKQVL